MVYCLPLNDNQIMEVLFKQSYTPENSELTFKTILTKEALLAINIFREYDNDDLVEALDFYLDEKEVYRLIGVLRLSLKEMKSHNESFDKITSHQFYSRDELDGGFRMCEVCGQPENKHIH